MHLKATALLGLSLLSLSLTISPASAMRSAPEQEAARPAVPAGKIVSRTAILNKFAAANELKASEPGDRRMVRQLLNSMMDHVGTLRGLEADLHAYQTPEALQALYRNMTETSGTFDLAKNVAYRLFNAIKTQQPIAVSQKVATHWWQEATSLGADTSFALGTPAATVSTGAASSAAASTSILTRPIAPTTLSSTVASSSSSRPIVADPQDKRPAVERLEEFYQKELGVYGDPLGWIDTNLQPRERLAHQSEASTVAILQVIRDMGYEPQKCGSSDREGEDNYETLFLKRYIPLMGRYVSTVKAHIAEFLLAGGKERIREFQSRLEPVIGVAQTIDKLYDTMGDLDAAHKHAAVMGIPVSLGIVPARRRQNLVRALHAGFKAADEAHQRENEVLEADSTPWTIDLGMRFLGELQAGFPGTERQDLPQILARDVVADDDFFLPSENARNLQKMFYGAKPYEQFPGLAPEGKEAFARAFRAAIDDPTNYGPQPQLRRSGPVIEEIGDDDPNASTSASSSRAITDRRGAEMRGAVVMRPRESRPY